MSRHTRWSRLILGLVVLGLLVFFEIQTIRKIGGQYFVNQARLKGDAQEFLQNMQRSLALDSTNGFAHFLLSRYYVETRNYQKAVDEALLARRSFSSFKGLMQIGSIYLKMNNYGKAIETFRQTHIMIPKNALAQNYLAYSYLRMNDVERAKEALSAVLRRDCLNANSLYLMGVVNDMYGKRRLGRYYHYWAFLHQGKKENPFYDHEHLLERIRTVN